MSRLFSPINLRELEIRNRVFLSPMCQYSAVDGCPGPWHFAHYGARAAGGVGLMIFEATAVCPEGRITPHDLGLWHDAQAEEFRRITDFVKAQGASPAVQLAHAGRKASTSAPWTGGRPLLAQDGGWRPLAPSPLPFFDDSPPPKEMSEAEIADIPALFAGAATRAHAAGFSAVEIHMAHGYLLHQFLSPLTNRRQDAYGGIENRTRLPLMVAEAVRKAFPDNLPVLVRISATDWKEGGWDLAQSLLLARELGKIGIDFIDVSTGGLIADAVPSVPPGPGFQTPFSAAIRRETGIMTGAVGFYTEALQAEKTLARGDADAILIGRELLRNPSWPLAAARALNDDIDWPRQYQRAKI